VRKRVNHCTLFGWELLRFDRTAGLKLVQDLARGVLAKADSCEEILLAVKTVLVGDPVEIGWTELLQRDFVLARLAFEEFAADLDGALALMLVKPMLDLVACARALGKA